MWTSKHLILTSVERIIALFIVFGLLIITFIAILFWKKDYTIIPPRIILQQSMTLGI